ncbi:MAG: NAD(P)-binding domain-containing protein [Elusimicrobiota bacterium]|jgi:thioredoxin reductase/NAD-dependent dihydropyrimidine dehydrogenase PreA subunit
MDATLTLGLTACGLGIVLAGLWHRRLEHEQSEAARKALQEARERGTHQAVAQHPLIKGTECLGCGSCAEACPAGDVLGLVNGTSHVIHGAKCIGYGKCAEACPVGAISVGLGDLSARPDIPILSPSLETSVPGLYIAGELGGIALIRHAVQQGTAAVDDIIRKNGGAGPKAPGVRDLVVVGAGPAGMAASLRAKEAGLDFLTLSADSVGGTIRKYPRRKLTLLQTVYIPLHGRLDEGVYEKERLVELWEKLASERSVPIEIGATLTAVRRDEGGFEVATNSGSVRARHVVLALGRRGMPRKLGVPGEDQAKVLYELADAATYTDQRILVVGGGDSAVEAATALANQPGNRVVLSYRKASFFRLKERNQRRLKEFADSGRIKVVLSSSVESIEHGAVVLRLEPGGPPERVRLDNDWVFVFAGGELPFALLKGMGIKFGGDEAALAGAPPAEAGPGGAHLVPRLFASLGWAIAACAALVFAAGWGYYGLPAAERPLHAYHALLKPSGTAGLFFGVLGTMLIALNLSYVVRRGLIRQERLGSPRSWMSFHVLTGLIGPLFILLHSAFSLRSPLASIAAVSLLVVVLTGLVGRYIYARTPRSVEGRELELAEIRRSLSAHREELERLGVPLEGLAASGAPDLSRGAGSVLAGFSALVRGDREQSLEYRKLEEAVLSSPHLRPIADDILSMGLRCLRERRWLARYHELRSLMSSWRFLHLWFALIMIVIAVFHIFVGLRHGRLELGHASTTFTLP